MPADVIAVHAPRGDWVTPIWLSVNWGKKNILTDIKSPDGRKRFVDFTQEEYERIMQTNLHGIVELTKLVGEKMIRRGQGGKRRGRGRGRTRLVQIPGTPFS